MLPDREIFKLPIEHWPSDWNSLLAEFGGNKITDSKNFWHLLMERYVTSKPLKNVSNEKCKLLFQQFWSVIGSQQIKSNKSQALFIAAKNDYDVFLKNLLSRLPESERIIFVNQKSSTGDTALHVATKENHLASAAILLDKGANPDSPGSFGETPLHLAAYNNSPEIINLLLTRGASCDIERDDKEKPIHIGIMMGSEMAVNALIKHDKNQLNALGREARSPLYRAVMSENENIMKLLLSYGVDVNQLNMISGYSALHLAAIMNKPKIITLLVKYKASPDMHDRAGLTSLQRCAMQKKPSYEAAAALIACGANVNAGDPPPLYMLAVNASLRSNWAADFAKLLIDNGAKIDTVTNGETVFGLLDKLKATDRLKNDELALYDFIKKKSKLSSRSADLKK